MALQIPLMSASVIQHLVTTTNPATSNAQSMDHVRCAALHNHIYELAWTSSGRSLDHMPRENWFERHGDAADQLRSVLQPSLVKFLEQAYALPLSEISFFYYVNGLASPTELWENNSPEWVDDDDDDPERWLTLYAANLNLGSHVDGLNYDQTKNTAVMQVDISDRDWTRNGEESEPLWFPLETVLSKWIEMVQVGKMTADNEESDAPNERYNPWTYHAWSQSQLEATVTAFHKLTAAIEAKLSITTSAVSPSPLVSTETLQQASVRKDSFAYGFLSTAKRPDPKIKYIAPGLMLPPESSQAFAALQQFTKLDISRDDENESDDEVEEHRHNRIPPILLFPLDTSTKISLNPNDQDNSCFNFRYIEKLSESSDGILTGLYTDSADRSRDITVAEESFRFILPYEIGQNEIARRSDVTTFNNHVSLYQHGFFPFGGEVWRAQRLQRLFEKWEQNINNDRWDVGEEGVRGGVDKWREADDDAQLSETVYRIDIDW